MRYLVLVLLLGCDPTPHALLPAPTVYVTASVPMSGDKMVCYKGGILVPCPVSVVAVPPTTTEVDAGAIFPPYKHGAATYRLAVTTSVNDAKQRLQHVRSLLKDDPEWRRHTRVRRTMSKRDDTIKASVDAYDVHSEAGEALCKHLDEIGWKTGSGLYACEVRK